MVLLSKKQIIGKKNRHSIVRKSKIINEKETEQLTSSQITPEQKKNSDSIVRKSNIIKKKMKGE